MSRGTLSQADAGGGASPGLHEASSLRVKEGWGYPLRRRGTRLGLDGRGGREAPRQGQGALALPLKNPSASSADLSYREGSSTGWLKTCDFCRVQGVSSRLEPGPGWNNRDTSISRYSSFRLRLRERPDPLGLRPSLAARKVSRV